MTAPGTAQRTSDCRLCCIQSCLKAASIKRCVEAAVLRTLLRMSLPPLPLLTQLSSRAAVIIIWWHTASLQCLLQHDMPICVPAG